MPHRLSLRPTGKHRKQRASDYSVSEKPDTLTDDIAAIDYALKLCGFNEDPQQYMPERRKKQIFAKGEKRRLVMEVLRGADRALTSREICIAILTDKDFDFTDKRRLNQTTTGIYNFLSRECEAGRVDRVEGWPVRWFILESLI